MKFKCSQSDLNEAVSVSARAVSPKSPIPALEGIKLFIKNDTLELTGYDLELGIQTKINIESDDCGECVFDAKLFSEMVRKMPGGDVNVEIDERLGAVITGSAAEYKITALSADEYPTLPVFEGESLTLPQQVLKNMISQTVFAAATNDNKPILTGELFDIKNGNFNLVAVDGYRLAVRSEKIDSKKTCHFVIKAKSLTEMSRLLKDGDDKTVTIRIGKKHISFEDEGFILISRLLEGDFHNYEGSIPTAHSTEVVVNAKGLIDSLERCSLLISETAKAPVRCRFNDGTLKITCSTALGKFSDALNVDITGSKVEIGFNCRYLLDALKASESDKVRLFFNGGEAPMKMLPFDGNAFTYLVLPMRLRND